MDNSDMILEILSRVPLKTLNKFRLVSRKFNSITYEPSLMRLHSQRTNTATGYFVQTRNYKRCLSTFVSVDKPNHEGQLKLSLDFFGEPVDILAVHQGLLFCHGRNSSNHYISKPSTKQWETIPNPLYSGFFINTGLLVLQTEPIRFKILVVSDGEDRNTMSKHYRCELFDSDLWIWKPLEDLELTYDDILDSKPATTNNGGLHWLISSCDSNKLLSFYEDEERWDLVSTPNSIQHSAKLTKLQGKLALIVVDFLKAELELWMMKTHNGDKVWIKEQTADLTRLNYELTHSSIDSVYLADTLFLKGLFGVMFYNFKTGHLMKLKLEGNYLESAFFIHTDYELIKLKPSRSRQSSWDVSVVFGIVFWTLLFCFVLHYFFA